jgi:hypothetical protein
VLHTTEKRCATYLWRCGVGLWKLHAQATLDAAHSAGQAWIVSRTACNYGWAVTAARGLRTCLSRLPGAVATLVAAGVRVQQEGTAVLTATRSMAFGVPNGLWSGL